MEDFLQAKVSAPYGCTRVPAVSRPGFLHSAAQSSLGLQVLIPLPQGRGGEVAWRGSLAFQGSGALTGCSSSCCSSPSTRRMAARSASSVSSTVRLRRKGVCSSCAVQTGPVGGAPLAGVSTSCAVIIGCGVDHSKDDCAQVTEGPAPRPMCRRTYGRHSSRITILTQTSSRPLVRLHVFWARRGAASCRLLLACNDLIMLIRNSTAVGSPASWLPKAHRLRALLELSLGVGLAPSGDGSLRRLLDCVGGACGLAQGSLGIV